MVNVETRYQLPAIAGSDGKARSPEPAEDQVRGSSGGGVYSTPAGVAFGVHYEPSRFVALGVQTPDGLTGSGRIVRSSGPPDG